MSLLDFLFPKRCVQCGKIGSYICPNCFSYLSFDTKTLCLVCQRTTVDGLTHPGCLRKYAIDGSFSAIPYNKTAQKLIYSFKYKPYLSDLKNFLGDLLFEKLSQDESFQMLLRNKWVFVPIPLSSSKLRKRGYNQSEILANELSKKLGFEVQNSLKRIKETKPQFGLKLKDRRKNVKGAFAIKKKKKYQMKGAHIFLVDDLLTSGATLMEGAKVLKRRGAKRVIGITLARD